jgi:hypothetical protein
MDQTRTVADQHSFGLSISQMPPDYSLKHWIQEQYRAIGINSNGTFVGKALFKQLLIKRYADSGRAKGHDKKSLKKLNQEIRRLVNA